MPAQPPPPATASDATRLFSQQRAAAAPGPPALSSATHVLWRDRHAVQFERGDRRVIVEPVCSDHIQALLSSAPPSPSAPWDPALDHLRTTLGELGFLESGPDFRRAAAIPRVEVCGRNRFTGLLAGALAGAGIAEVVVRTSGEVSRHDACPGGLLPSDEGREFSEAVEAVTRRATAARHSAAARAAAGRAVAAVDGCLDEDGGRGDTSPRPDRPDGPLAMTILTDPWPADPAVRDALHAAQRPHLVAALDADYACIGPLVLPGVTPCLRCLDLHRLDRDDAWPLLATQLSTRRLRRRPPEVALCLMAAGIVCMQIAAHLAGEAVPTLAGTLECRHPEWQFRRRPWSRHPGCDCARAAQADRARHNEMVIER